MEPLCSVWRVIRYDSRGFGMSEKMGKDPRTLDAVFAYAQAVMIAAEAEQALLFGSRRAATAPAVALAQSLRDHWSSLALLHPSLSRPPELMQERRSEIDLGADDPMIPDDWLTAVPPVVLASPTSAAAGWQRMREAPWNSSR